MKIIKSLKRAYHELGNTDNPYLEAELLLAHVLHKSREWILAHSEEKLNFLQILNYKLQIRRRRNNTPLAYITGAKEFFGLDFSVNKNVLVPRPETEMMVEEAIALATIDAQRTTIIDVGTGSGCIIISVAHSIVSNLKYNESPEALFNHFDQQNALKNERIEKFDFHAIDISRNALHVAQENAVFNGVDDIISFHEGNLLEPLFKRLTTNAQATKIIICANLPYLTPEQIQNSPSIKKEPRKALVAGSDGLKYYRELFQQINKLQKISSHKLLATCLLEIDDTQKDNITGLIKQELPQAKFKIKNDLKNQARLVAIDIE